MFDQRLKHLSNLKASFVETDDDKGRSGNGRLKRIIKSCFLNLKICVCIEDLRASRGIFVAESIEFG